MKENTKSVYKVVSIGILCSAMLLLGMTSMDTSAQISPTYVASGIIYDEEVDYWNISNVNKGNLFLLTIQAETGLSSWESRLSYLNLTEIDKIVKADTHIYEFIANETGCYLLRLYTPSPTVNYTINCSHPVRIQGDLDDDGDVDFDDIVAIAMAYGSKPGAPNWDVDADLDCDGDVDFDDVVTAAMNYGKRDC